MFTCTWLRTTEVTIWLNMQLLHCFPEISIKEKKRFLLKKRKERERFNFLTCSRMIFWERKEKKPNIWEEIPFKFVPNIFFPLLKRSRKKLINSFCILFFYFLNSGTQRYPINLNSYQSHNISKCYVALVNSSVKTIFNLAWPSQILSYELYRWVWWEQILSF